MCVFSLGVFPLQSDWSLSYARGLDFASQCVNNNNNVYAARSWKSAFSAELVVSSFSFVYFSFPGLFPLIFVSSLFLCYFRPSFFLPLFFFLFLFQRRGGTTTRRGAASHCLRRRLPLSSRRTERRSACKRAAAQAFRHLFTPSPCMPHKRF